jgi:hypothetical protein
MRIQFHLSAFMALALCLALAGNDNGAMAQSQRPFLSEDNNCESNKATWDSIAIDSEGDLIILIARLDGGERSRDLSRRRLHNLYTYLTYVREIPREKIIRAEGARARGRGRVEVYLRGKLRGVFTVGRNEDLRGGECEMGASPIYYPMERRLRH